jgi:Fe-S oxidoreductase
MCPSYMVTREEKHTTRGRAHLLFEMVHRGPIDRGWRDERVKDALDLCLACKGCKSDCPVNVDVATYKAEFLSHYWDGRLRPRSAYAFGLVDQWARLAALAPGLANLFTQAPGLRSVAKALAGVAQERELPPFAAKTFRAWFAERPPRNAGAEPVVLWADTFNDHFMPETAQAATEVLEHAGYRVTVPHGHFCCGRPLYDFGMLDLAKAYLRRVLSGLADAIRDRTPVVVLEPSCCSVFRDELPALLPHRGDARKLADQVVTLSEFLTSPRVRATGYAPPKLRGRAIVQGHCHHKAIMRFEPERHLLEEMGLETRVLASGCCGMAGSFGYEAGSKYAVSIAAGERVLLPEVRRAAPTTLVLADGFSCKEQIAQQTERRALHLAEVMKLAIDLGPECALPPRPERLSVESRSRAQRRSMLRAGAIATGAVATAAVWLFLSARRRTRRRLPGAARR